jgi:thiol-disulfide isomerase/thioredoxin|tara:strand:+ start:735 stop:1109 length:375 start_codon:yes stop_codon:yes gene_type:complete
MTVERLSLRGFEKIIRGRTTEDAACVVKFYSMGCPYCVALKDPFEQIADSYGDLHFFAFNTADHPHLDNTINVNGVPSICFVQPGIFRPRVIIMQDPEEPNEDTWYTKEQIEQFIEKNYDKEER